MTEFIKQLQEITKKNNDVNIKEIENETLSEFDKIVKKCTKNARTGVSYYVYRYTVGGSSSEEKNRIRRNVSPDGNLMKMLIERFGEDCVEYGKGHLDSQWCGCNGDDENSFCYEQICISWSK